DLRLDDRRAPWPRGAAPRSRRRRPVAGAALAPHLVQPPAPREHRHLRRGAGRAPDRPLGRLPRRRRHLAAGARRPPRRLPLERRAPRRGLPPHRRVARPLDPMSRTIGFDLDMTLVDSRPGIRAVYEELSRQTGVFIDAELAVFRLGPPLTWEL